MTEGFNGATLSNMNAQARAKAAGGMTPGQAIARETSLESAIVDLVGGARDRYGKLAENPAYRPGIEAKMGREIARLVKEVLSIENARNNQDPPTKDAVDAVARPLIDQAIASMTGSAEIVVKVEASPDLLARIVSQVKSQMPGVSLNGVGSTGKSSPDVINRGQY